MSAPRDRDIRVWLSEDTFSALRRRASDDDRPVSVYVRRLIERDLAEHGVDGADAARAAQGRSVADVR